jgi:hypothetical protein
MSVKTRSTQAVIKRICRSKVAYEDEGLARVFANAVWVNNKSKQVPYLCKNCGKFHLTTILEQEYKND